MMHMSYWFGTDLGSFVFPGYNVTTTWGLIATCLGLGSLAVIFEALKLVQIKLRQMTIASLPSELPTSSEDSSLLRRFTSRPFEHSASTHCGSWARWFLEVFHWSVHTTLGYLLMLAVMSYNGYLSIALALGGGLGYWVFGPSLQQLNMRQFDDKRKNMRCEPECSDAISDATMNAGERESTTPSITDELAAGVSVEVHT